MPEQPGHTRNTWTRFARAIAGHAVDLSGVDQATLERMAIEHGIGPLLHRAVCGGSTTGVGEDGRAWLRECAHREAARELWLDHTTREFMEVLGGHGFDSLLLKGAAVAPRYYPEPWLRPRCDTDVWVRAEDIHTVAQALDDAGYKVVNLAPNNPATGQFHAAAPTARGEPAWFDVHYRISNRTLLARSLEFNECLADAPAPHAMAPWHLLLHAAIHRVAHGRNAARHRLIWLWDIHLLHESMDTAERERFVQCALDRGLGCLCADALADCQAAFGTAVDPAMPGTLRARRHLEPTARLLDAGKWAWAWADITCHERFSDRLRQTWSLLRRYKPQGSSR